MRGASQWRKILVWLAAAAIAGLHGLPAKATTARPVSSALLSYGRFDFPSPLTTNISPSGHTTTLSYAVNSDNELTKARGQSSTYEGDGNLTASQPGITYGYDQENRLPGITNNPSWATTFVYEGLGRLRRRQEYYWLGIGWTSANLTNYVYDGNLVLQMRQSTTPVETFTRGPDLSGQTVSALNGGLPRESGTSLTGAGGIGGLLARTTWYSGGNWSTHHYYHADGNGNITYLELTNQTLAASYRYDPYGNVFASSGTVASANLYRFSSKELHAASGMYYYGYRFYQPEFQRWINRDPIQEWGGVNLYGFVRNNPFEFVDPYGEDWKSDLWNTYTAITLCINTCMWNPSQPGNKPVPQPPPASQEQQKQQQRLRKCPRPTQPKNPGPDPDPEPKTKPWWQVPLILPGEFFNILFLGNPDWYLPQQSAGGPYS